jgi:hypothetical protein
MPAEVIMQLIDREMTNVAIILALDELGGRRRDVYYRLRQVRDNQNLNLGRPGYMSTPWQQIIPRPVTEDVSREFQIDTVGLITTGDIEMHVNRTVITRELLQQCEFYISDISQAPAPEANNQANYDLIGGQVLQGGAGVRARNRSYWICYLRRRQTKDRM